MKIEHIIMGDRLARRSIKELGWKPPLDASDPCRHENVNDLIVSIFDLCHPADRASEVVCASAGVAAQSHPKVA
jgi:hypothetical protein